eukprot:7501825-Lingulodinium_polyedra.AAC.1
MDGHGKHAIPRSVRVVPGHPFHDRRGAGAEAKGQLAPDTLEFFGPRVNVGLGNQPPTLTS